MSTENTVTKIDTLMSFLPMKMRDGKRLPAKFTFSGGLSATTFDARLVAKGDRLLGQRVRYTVRPVERGDATYYNLVDVEAVSDSDSQRTSKSGLQDDSVDGFVAAIRRLTEALERAAERFSLGAVGAAGPAKPERGPASGLLDTLASKVGETAARAMLGALASTHGVGSSAWRQAVRELFAAHHLPAPDFDSDVPC